MQKRTGERSDRPDAAAEATGSDARVRLLIVGDRLLLAEALRFFFESRQLGVATIAVSTQEAVDAATQHTPDVAIIDVGTTDMEPLQLGDRLRGVSSDIELLALAGSTDQVSQEDAHAAGFSGFVSKDATLMGLVDSIATLARGETAWPSPPEGRSPESDSDAYALLVRQLSLREHEVLVLLAEGSSSKEIAQVLSIAPNTVRTHIQNILTKLQVNTRLQAVMFAVRHGVVRVQTE